MLTKTNPQTAVTPITPVTTAPKVALTTGITGQDGSHLAALLIEKGDEVHGLKH